MAGTERGPTCADSVPANIANRLTKNITGRRFSPINADLNEPVEKLVMPSLPFLIGAYLQLIGPFSDL